MQLPSDNCGVPVGLVIQEPFIHNEQLLKRNSRASDTSSAYSGSDMMQSSVDDPENPEELSGLMESVVDSDEEEGYAESTEVSRHWTVINFTIFNFSSCVTVISLKLYTS